MEIKKIKSMRKIKETFLGHNFVQYLKGNKALKFKKIEFKPYYIYKCIFEKNISGPKLDRAPGPDNIRVHLKRKVRLNRRFKNKFKF